MQVLSRRTKNNPVLVGDPGVGKTAIVEGLAQKIVSNDGPETLRGKQLYTLDPRRAGRRFSLPRRFRRAPQEGAQGDPHARRHHPVHRRAPHPRRCRCRRRRHPTPRRSSSRCSPVASCRPSVPPHSTSTASTSRRTRPRAPLPEDHRRRAHRGAHDRDPEGPCAIATKRTTASRSPIRRWWPQPTSRRPLHLRSSSARQGDRPHRRSRLASAHQAHGDASRLQGARELHRAGAAAEEGGRRGATLRRGRQAA